VTTSDIAEYLVCLVKEFAKARGMTDVEACNLLQRENLLSLAEKHYDVVHTLSFANVIELFEQRLQESRKKK